MTSRRSSDFSPCFGKLPRVRRPGVRIGIRRGHGRDRNRPLRPCLPSTHAACTAATYSPGSGATTGTPKLFSWVHSRAVHPGETNSAVAVLALAGCAGSMALDDTTKASAAIFDELNGFKAVRAPGIDPDDRVGARQ